MFKYIFAFLVIAIAWAAAFILKERLPHGFDIAIAVTVLTVAVLVGLVLYRKYRARKAARGLAEAEAADLAGVPSPGAGSALAEGFLDLPAMGKGGCQEGIKAAETAFVR